MPFNNSLPEWNKTATAPTQTKKDAGWSAGEHPPASIFDWFFNTTFKALQELQQEAINTDQKGINNGVATLDATGDLPIGQADNILNWVKGFGVGDVAKDISSTDLNALDATGFYRGQTLTNAPGGSAWHQIINIKHSATYKVQIAATYGAGITTPAMYIRQNNNGTWGAWTQLAQYDATGKVAIANLPDATTALKGISQLNDTITSTSTSQAATANAVKQVVDWAKGFGLGDVAKDVSSTDLNSLDATGFYKGTSLTNGPSGATLTFIVNLKHTAVIKNQIAVVAGTVPAVYIRYNNNGTWGAWSQLAQYDATGKIATANLPAATTTVAGIAQLSDSLSDASTTKAATANAIKQIVDDAQMAKLTADTGFISSLSVDIDTVYASGFYYVGSTARAASPNIPSASNLIMIVYQFSSNTAAQVAIEMQSAAPKQWKRYASGGVWGAWQQDASYDTNGKIPVANLPTATTTVAGVAQLADSISDTSTTKAATANSVKLAVDWAKGFGLGDVAKVLTNGDANTLDGTGFYVIGGASATNLPVNGATYYITHVKYTASYKLQTAVHANDGVMHLRVYDNGVWDPWTQLATYDANGKVATANLPVATTSAAGIAQLADSITDTSTTKAATANSVKLAVDWVKGYGLGSIGKDISNTDLNSLTTSNGFYKGSNLTNAPDADFWHIINMVHSATFVSQIAVDLNNNNPARMYLRTCNSGAWGAWSQMETTAGAQAKADAAETNAKNASAPIGHVGSGGTSHAAATTTTNGFMISTDKSKLDGIAAGAEVNQNAFSTVQVNGTNIIADVETDTLFINSGAGIEFTPDAAIDSFTISLKNPTWTNLTLQNGTTVFSTRTPRYTKQGDEVIVEGEVVATGAVVIGTLPVGYRPPQLRSFKVSQNWSTSNDGATVYVGTDGTITIQVAASYTQSISLMGIRFYLS